MASLTLDWIMYIPKELAAFRILVMPVYVKNGHANNEEALDDPHYGLVLIMRHLEIS